MIASDLPVVCGNHAVSQRVLIYAKLVTIELWLKLKTIILQLPFRSYTKSKQLSMGIDSIE